jgi:uncharacterized protein YccT (UPF0319 family)
MLAELHFRINTTNVQKATWLRDRVGEYLEADADTTLISKTGQQVKVPHEVLGVDTTAKQKFSQTVDAANAAEAEAAVATTTKVVVLARRTGA